jgi:Putative TOS1-like glycosyl hydrolase (DUF2401)/Glycine-rich protein domain (DUF2403)
MPVRSARSPWPPLLALLAACGGKSAGALDASGAEGVDGSTPSGDAGDARAEPSADGAPAVGAADGGGSEPSPVTTPAACPASDDGARPLGADTFTPNTGKTAVTSLTYTHVGAAGAYAEVVSGWSKTTGCVGDSSGALCKTQYRAEKRVDGPLAPFDEEQTLVFAGPVELYRIGIYSPAGGAWRRTAYWDRCTSDGLVFAGNKHWYECGGFVESYVSADGREESAEPVQFAGSVAAGVEVHVNASTLCAAGECGYTTGLPLHGFAGDADGSKLFAVTLRMPIGSTTPAYWILPTQVIRANQYGCNCRGMGSDPTYKGGCGELDVAEILGGVASSLEATTTLYSFQDITGGGTVTFARPVQEAATFVVLYDAPSRSIGIRRLSSDALALESELSAARVEELSADLGTERALK